MAYSGQILRHTLLFMPRLIALIIASTFLVSCSKTSGGVVGDYAPEWLGGMPKGVPPRPGTPEYDAFKKAQQAEAERDKSKDPARPKSEAPKAEIKGCTLITVFLNTRCGSDVDGISADARLRFKPSAYEWESTMDAGC